MLGTITEEIRNANVWLKSTDPDVLSEQLTEFPIVTRDPIIHNGRRWVFDDTYIEKAKDGTERVWLVFMDRGPARQDSSP
jgi:hypothetical protein